ncbi:hypothetical protein FA13DRAFT_1806964 [Coprinellus micaceus]|uniref:Uncharacterized protein n=1 Tax=Coprinellus micaceus TaxID=71717 RepID=A0A4Y7RIS4_COPMI|nr:hypothetical protein FA13DRAFT_1806964 [Coprinellus micaceus]
MPKDNSHISHFSRREHTSLREQAHTRRHQLHIQNLSPLKGINWCGAGLTASVEADLGTRELLEPFALPDPPMEQDTMTPRQLEPGVRNLIQALKANATLRRRMVMLERHGDHLQSQLKIQKRAIASSEADAEGARRLLEIVEARFWVLEETIEKLREESYHYRKGWLSEHYSLRDLLRFVPDRNEPTVSCITSSSRKRFLSFSSPETESLYDVEAP